MKVALVYDRLNKIGGAEVVLQAFHSLFPEADWYTSFFDPTRASFAKNWSIKTSWFNRFAWLRTHHEWLPWLMPFIFESFDLCQYDLVISIGSAECKGIISKPGTFHLHYCLTPTRYLYSHATEYLNNPLYRFVGKYLRAWDQVAAARPDKMIAISTQVKKRIQKYYNRDSEILFPPVDTKKFRNTGKLGYWKTGIPKSYYLVVSRLVPYKKIDILVRAFALLPTQNLVVVGEGSEYGRLKRMATSNVHFAGFVPDSELSSYYSHCLAFLQANVEDFGIAMVEAQFFGKPVIAYDQGGAKDIVISGVTGLLLPDNKVESFVHAIDKFSSLSFDSVACRKNVSRFDIHLWQKEMQYRISQYVK